MSIKNGGPSKHSPAKKARLPTLKYADLEDWRKDNEHIYKGYHPITGSWRESWLTLLGQPHTETINILTHLLGAVIAASVFLYTFRHLALPKIFGIHSLHPPPLLPEKQTNLLHFIYPFPGHDASITYLDSWVFSSFYLAAFTCFACSAAFHTSLLHSQSVSDAFHKLDYVGIVALITGTYYPALYYGFYCEPFWQTLYMLGVTAFGLTTAYFVLSPGYSTPVYRRVRTFLFIGLGVSGVVPVVHKVLSQGYEHANRCLGLDWLLIGGAFYIVGALMYAERVPESLFPGKFDIYGASHQIFHIACLFAALSHYIAICKAHNYHHFASLASCSIYERALARLFGVPLG